MNEEQPNPTRQLGFAVEMSDFVANAIKATNMSAMEDLAHAKNSIESALTKLQGIEISLSTVVEQNQYTLPLRAAISQLVYCIEHIKELPDTDTMSDICLKELGYDPEQ